MAINVSGWVITSSFFLTLAISKATCRADVPLLVAIAYLAPVYLAISSSNLSTNLPTDDTNVESMHSLKYLFSLPINYGSCKGIGLFVW